MKSKILQKRFDFRLSEEQKKLMVQATKAGNYKTLTEFVLEAIQEKARKILQEKETTLSSELDCEIFVEALLNPPQPNPKLLKSVKNYQKFLRK